MALWEIISIYTENYSIFQFPNIIEKSNNFKPIVLIQE